jgi:bacterial/archaeal transporter family-2 protein
MSGRTIYLLVALAGGAILPVQVALNTLLRRYVGEPMQVTFISYFAGAVASLVLCIAAQYPLPTVAALSQTEWWMWIGGCLGTFYVWATIFTAPKIGAALALALTIAGQMIMALLLDHYGAIGLTQYTASPTRIAGVVLVVLGVSLVAYSRQ